MFPLWALRGSRVSDNSSASLRVIYYLYHTDFTAWFFCLNFCLVAGKCDCIAQHSRWLCTAVSGYELCRKWSRKFVLAICKDGFSLSLTCPVVYFLTAICWEKPSGRMRTPLETAWLDEDNFFRSPLLLCAGGLVCATAPNDWRAHTHNCDQGRKTDFNPRLPCREDTVINKDSMEGWLHLQPCKVVGSAVSYLRAESLRAKWLMCVCTCSVFNFFCWRCQMTSL